VATHCAEADLPRAPPPRLSAPRWVPPLAHGDTTGGMAKHDAEEKLAPYAHLLGVRTNREVAKMAGVAPSSVHRYRAARGIVAGAKKRRPTPNRAKAAPNVVVALAIASAPPSALGAWAVTADHAGLSRTYVVLAHDIPEAAEKAVAALRGQATVLALAYLEEVL
jgi:hypothetical protein